MVKRGTKARRSGSAVDQLQAALTRSLKESVAETVSSVCESFQHAVEAQTTSPASTEESGGYDQYFNTCRRLVDYIKKHMEASPGFEDQMDRIILACHSGATERVLNSVVTKGLWFHRRGDAPPAQRETRSHSIGRGSMSKKKVKREASVPRMPTRASTESPAMHTRSASGSKRATRGSPQDVQPAKRPRRAARKVIQDSSDEEEEEEEKPVACTTRNQKETEEDDDTLLSFKDAIGELCYPDLRTPSETKFFKERLRKSIQFVDALLCKPPLGKVCGRGCKKIRSQMCSSSTPCKNKMCRIWHDVEAHTDRCQNQQCEFKNRILLRETMHKLEMKDQQIAETKADLERKHTQLKQGGVNDKALMKAIARLGQELDECDGELGVLEATKKTFWVSLNEIGIEAKDDVVDNFPDFATHYEDKKTPHKARKAVTASATHPSAASSRSSRDAVRHDSVGPHGGDADDENGANDADESGNDHAARRSTSSGRRSPAPDSDDETKGGEEEMSDADTYHPAPIAFPRPDEPPLPPAGPPPFRQNPEFDREYSVHASGYSIHPPVDDLEAPAVATSIETTKVTEPPSEHGLTKEQLADMQRESDEISGIIAGMTDNPPPLPLSTEPINTAELVNMPVPINTTDPVNPAEPVNAAKPVNPVGLIHAVKSVNAAEPVNTTGFTIRGSQPQNP
ncbi:hypothetical protein GN244_ATG03765 [Phytophthora infestans]|uniref:Uncharacterized protein n=1 Tax=Phytophthora infestans TaxID=4787 RepID=A0A833SZ71_PHYIN|nr:hypothetical protein GN244_ATG03765 [Phytophthora infestans]KAI9995368.1 hypothetical protein PInf_012425 [Phytophthora infestans]